MDKVSYALGMSIGQSLMGTGVDNLNFEDFLKGVKAIYENTVTEVSAEEGNQVLNEYFTKKKAEQEKELKKEREENLQSSRDYLKENKNQDGIQTTPSGLQYKVITQGEGKQPTSHSRVKCHYEGRLINGQVFDSSYKRGEPAEFSLNQVIPGWTEGLQLMKVGSKYEFHIPPALGYGKVGVPGHIPGNAVLIFTVELLDVE